MNRFALSLIVAVCIGSSGCGVDQGEMLDPQPVGEVSDVASTQQAVLICSSYRTISMPLCYPPLWLQGMANTNCANTWGGGYATNLSYGQSCGSGNYKQVTYRCCYNGPL